MFSGTWGLGWSANSRKHPGYKATLSEAKRAASSITNLLSQSFSHFMQNGDLGGLNVFCRGSRAAVFKINGLLVESQVELTFALRSVL